MKLFIVGEIYPIANCSYLGLVIWGFIGVSSKLKSQRPNNPAMLDRIPLTGPEKDLHIFHMTSQRSREDTEQWLGVCLSLTAKEAL